MSLDLTEDKSTLVQVMAWCCQATSHYLSQRWPRSLSPYGVIRPQWVNWCVRKILLRNHQNPIHFYARTYTQECGLQNFGHVAQRLMWWETHRNVLQRTSLEYTDSKSFSTSRVAAWNERHEIPSVFHWHEMPSISIDMKYHQFPLTWNTISFHWHEIPSVSSEIKIDGLVQDCSNSSALAMELLQSCTKPLKCGHMDFMVSQTNGNSAVFSTACSWWRHINIRAPHYCSFICRIQWWLVDSPHKGTVLEKLLETVTIADALEILQSCTKQSISCAVYFHKAIMR